MPNSSRRGKKTAPPPDLSGRYATPEAAADAKNAGLIEWIKKMGLIVVKKDVASSSRF